MATKTWWAAVVTGAVLVTLAWSPPVLANMSAPWRPGDPLGEPLGATADVRIVREDLHFDLRPLAEGAREVPVTVRYELDNPGPARDLELAFLAPGLGQGRVTLDGKSLATGAARQVEVPGAWEDRQAPTGFADVDGKDDERQEAAEETRKLDALPFVVPLPSGRHVVEVTYRHHTGRLDSPQALYRVHVVRYLLAPAERWGGFGGLRVRAELPQGWEWRGSPGLVASSTGLAGTYDRLPGPWLQIAVRRPAEFAWFADLFLPLAIFGLLLALVAPWRVGQRTASPGFASVAAVLSSAVVAVAPALGAYLLWHALLDGTQKSGTAFYGYMVAALLLTPLGAGVGLLLGGASLLVSRLVARRRARS